jgi:hypothetical protein
MKIKVGDDVHDVEGSPAAGTGGITLVCHDGTGPRIEYPDRVAIDVHVSTHHGSRLSDGGWHADTAPLVEYAFGAHLGSYSRTPAENHLVGLVDLSLKLDDMGVPFVWVQPESLLHPGVAARLGDLAAYFYHRAQYRIGVRIPGLTSVAGGPISAREYLACLDPR